MDKIEKNCDNIKKKSLSFHADPEVVKAIGTNYRVVPSYETSLFDYKFMEYVSFKTNEQMLCNWQKFIFGTPFKDQPFQFVSKRDQHFFQQKVNHAPSQSFFRRTEYRLKLKAGPGVDTYGQIPIPNEMMMKRLGREHTSINHIKVLKKTPKKLEKIPLKHKHLEAT